MPTEVLEHGFMERVCGGEDDEGEAGVGVGVCDGVR